MSLPNDKTYSADELHQLVHAYFWWDRTATLWRHHFQRGKTVWVEAVVDGVGPRRWFFGFYTGVDTMDESPPFGSLDGLLLWAKLEGLL